MPIRSAPQSHLPLTTPERRGSLQGHGCNSHLQVGRVNATLAECISNAAQCTHSSCDRNAAISTICRGEEEGWGHPLLARKAGAGGPPHSQMHHHPTSIYLGSTQSTGLASLCTLQRTSSVFRPLLACQIANS